MTLNSKYEKTAQKTSNWVRNLFISDTYSSVIDFVHIQTHDFMHTGDLQNGSFATVIYDDY